LADGARVQDPSPPHSGASLSSVVGFLRNKSWRKGDKADAKGDDGKVSSEESAHTTDRARHHEGGVLSSPLEVRDVPEATSGGISDEHGEKKAKKKSALSMFGM
jgi:hypothetical protein